MIVRRSRRRGAEIGTLVGMAVAVVFLVVVGILLVRPEESSYRALIAVWLWALPALGIFGCAGWLAGKGIDLATDVFSHRHSPKRRGRDA